MPLLSVTPVTANAVTVRIDLNRALSTGEWWQALSLGVIEHAAINKAAAPSRLLQPQVVCLSTSALTLIGGSDDVLADQLAGNELPSLASPAARCYAGHQFGHFAGKLGDGAALSLGVMSASPSGSRFEIGFKGSGATPFTRREAGTGRKSLPSMVVEMLVAESLAALGVPTVRGLAVVVGYDEDDGDDEEDSVECAVLTRLSPSLVRFGSFEVCLPNGHSVTGRRAPFASDWALLRELVDECILAHPQHFASCAAAAEDDEEDDTELRIAPRYREFVYVTTRHTARLAACWQAVGVVHGVLNTDNLSMLGETLDHGSCGFMETASRAFTGRYQGRDSARNSFANQPDMMLLGCQQLADALLPLHCTLPSEMAEAVREHFRAAYDAEYRARMGAKLGLRAPPPELLAALTELMFDTGADWAGTFRALSDGGAPEELASTIARRWCADSGDVAVQLWAAWLRRYAQAVEAETAADDGAGTDMRLQRMRAVNPIVVPRTWLLDKAAAAAAAHDFCEVRRLLHVVTHPFTAPDDEAEAWPKGMAMRKGVVAPIDPSRLEPRVASLAQQALESADYWRQLCPWLTVSDAAAAPSAAELRAQCPPFQLSDARVAALRAELATEGVFNLASADLPWSVSLGAVVRGIEALHAAGWPPAFILAYEEPWRMALQLSPLLQCVTGNPLSYDWLAFRVPSGVPGYPPHRDKALSPGARTERELGFRADGTPLYTTCWIALVDVPAASSCLMSVPKPHDPGYLRPGGLHPPIASASNGPQGAADYAPEEQGKMRPLPLGAGACACFSHRLFHWSKQAEAGQPTRYAFALSGSDLGYDLRYLPQHLLPLPPLPLRVALAAGQTFAYSHHSRRAFDDELLWACFLSQAEHFDTSFARRVMEGRAHVAPS